MCTTIEFCEEGNRRLGRKSNEKNWQKVDGRGRRYGLATKPGSACQLLWRKENSEIGCPYKKNYIIFYIENNWPTLGGHYWAAKEEIVSEFPTFKKNFPGTSQIFQIVDVHKKFIAISIKIDCASTSCSSIVKEIPQRSWFCVDFSHIGFHSNSASHPIHNNVWQNLYILRLPDHQFVPVSVSFGNYAV